MPSEASARRQVRKQPSTPGVGLSGAPHRVMPGRACVDRLQASRSPGERGGGRLLHCNDRRGLHRRRFRDALVSGRRVEIRRLAGVGPRSAATRPGPDSQAGHPQRSRRGLAYRWTADCNGGSRATAHHPLAQAASLAHRRRNQTVCEGSSEPVAPVVSWRVCCARRPLAALRSEG